VALEAEEMHYRDMWSVKTLFALSRSQIAKNNTTKLILNGSTLTDDNNIFNGINNYFSTIGETLDEELSQKHSNFNCHNFKSYCHKPYKTASLLHLQIAFTHSYSFINKHMK